MVKYGGFTLLSHPLVVKVLLPFLLVFTVTFGVLQKSEIFGKDKKQIDSLVALAIGLLLVSLANAIDMIVQLVSFVSVALVVLLVFFLMVGMFTKAGTPDEVFSKLFKSVIGVPIIIAFFVAVFSIVGVWDYLWQNVLVFGGDRQTLVMNVLFIAVIAGAIYAVLKGTGSSGESGKKEEKKTP